MRLDMIDQDLLSIQEARILAENARDAQLRMASFSQSKLDAIVEALAQAVAPHAKDLAMRSADETDYGNWQDKLLKNRFVCEYLPRELRPLRCVGVIGEDPAHGITDVGVPAGVILALPPATSPVSTAIYNVLIAIKSGNAVIIAPHPRAARVSAEVMDLLITAGIAAGLPEGAIAYLQTLTKAGTEALMNHDDVALVLITGVPAMLAAAQQSGKRVIYGGAGNGPAFIEKTADLEQAVCDIIASKTFDNGVVSAAEQAVVVDGAVEAAVRGHFMRHGAYFMNADEAERLGELFYYKDGSANPEPVGKTALELARRAHIEVPLETTLLIAEQKYVSLNNPYSKGKLCPVLSYYVEDDWMNACAKCIELLLTERRGHTLVIHSQDRAVIEQFALKKPVARVLVNTPAVYGSMGMTTHLFPAMTLGSGTVGRGITADNVSPLHLIYVRKVAAGVRDVADLGLGTPARSETKTPGTADERIKQLRYLLEQALADVHKSE